MGSLIGGIISNNNSKREAEAIQEGNELQAQLSREALDLQRPIFEAGNTARDQQLNALGLNGAASADQSYQNFENSGFYDAARQGFDIDRQYLEGSAAAAGGLFSGAHAKALDDRARERASGAYGQYYNGLAGISGAGQVASGSAGGILQQQGANTANSFAQSAAVRSNGSNQLGNSIGGAVDSVGNALFGGF